MQRDTIREGTRGGQGEFRWSAVKEDKDRENYLGHSVNAPQGRWQSRKDIHWYARDKEETDADKAARERKEEIRKLKEAEEDALAVALGFAPTVRDANGEGTGANNIKVEKSEKDKEIEALEKEQKAREKALRREQKEMKRAERELRRKEKEEERRARKGRSHRRSRSPSASRSRSPERYRRRDDDRRRGGSRERRDKYERSPRERYGDPSTRAKTELSPRVSRRSVDQERRGIQDRS